MGMNIGPTSVVPNSDIGDALTARANASLLAGADAAPQPNVPAGLHRADDGTLTYSGCPTALSDTGEPMVFTPQGWMTVKAFEASPLTTADLQSAIATVQLSPGSPLAKKFRGETP